MVKDDSKNSQMFKSGFSNFMQSSENSQFKSGTFDMFNRSNVNSQNYNSFMQNDKKN